MMRNYDYFSVRQINRLKSPPEYTIVRMNWSTYKANILEIVEWLNCPSRKGIYRTFHDLLEYNGDEAVIGVGIQRAEIALEFKMRWG